MIMLMACIYISCILTNNMVFAGGRPLNVTGDFHISEFKNYTFDYYGKVDGIKFKGDHELQCKGCIWMPDKVWCENMRWHSVKSKSRLNWKCKSSDGKQ